MTSEYPTSDSFERPDYWWCKNPDLDEVIHNDKEGEDRRVFIKKEYKLEKLRYVAGYVCWNEKDPKIPSFCPLPNIE